MTVTKPAEQRARQRIGLDKSAAERMATKALNTGLGRPQMTGTLRGYVERRRLENPSGEIFMYGEDLYVFAGNVLITTLKVPNEHKLAALKQWRKWKERIAK